MKQIKKNKQSRKQNKIRGKGDYTVENSISDPIKRIEAKVDHIERSVNKKASAKGAASTIGRTLGNFVNQGDMGALAGETLAKLFGHGDYTVKSNSLIPQPGQQQVMPKFASNKRGTRIIEREYIGDIVSGALSGSSTAFNLVNYPINPTNPNVFPWLSTIASLYDQWEPNGVVFEFVSTSSEFNGANQALGAVIMATDYDLQDPLFTSKQQMENSDYACSTKPAVSLMHGIECDQEERPLKIMYTSTGTADPRFSTLGNFQLATQGVSAANINLGELWVSYDITFYKKQQMPLSDLLPFYYGVTFVNNVVGKGVFYNMTTVSSNGFITLRQDASTSVVVFDKAITSGHYVVLSSISNWQGEVAAGVGVNCVLSAVTGWPNPIGSGYSTPSPGVSGANRDGLYCYTITASGATITFPTKLVGTGFGSLTILQIPTTVGIGG